MKQKQQYELLELEIIPFCDCDVISGSGDTLTPLMPFSDGEDEDDS